MKHLTRTTAIALVMGGFTFAAQAQTADTPAGGETVCTTAWGQIDTNSDGMVSRDEMTKSVDAEFSTIDQDGDGTITLAEYTDCLSSVQPMQSAQTDRSEKNFMQADANSDDKVTRDEFRTAAERAYEDRASGSAEDEAAFSRYTFMTEEDMQDSADIEEMSEDEAAARSALAFRSLDSNRDGVIEMQEWAARSPSTDLGEQAMTERFDRADEDGSGTLDKQEYAAAKSTSVDSTTTASTDASEGELANTPAVDTDETGNTPVFIYRFMTF